MSEFHLSAGLGQPQYAYQQPQQPNVEWYSAGTAGHQYVQQPYGAFDAHSSNTGAAFGSFEDEPPLLEGAVRP